MPLGRPVAGATGPAQHLDCGAGVLLRHLAAECLGQWQRKGASACASAEPCRAMARVTAASNTSAVESRARACIVRRCRCALG